MTVGTVSVFFVYSSLDVPYGGANSFNKNLKACLARNAGGNLVVTEDSRRADVLFVNAATRGPRETVCFSFRKRTFLKVLRDQWLRPYQLANLKSRRGLSDPRGFFDSADGGVLPVVQRLDGVTQRYGREDGGRFDDLQVRLNRMSAHTVFQSRYCRDSFAPLLGQGKPSTIIYNGTDGGFFPWTHRRKPGSVVKVLAASWSSNLRKGHAGLAALARLPHVEVTYAGRWPEAVDAGGVRVTPFLPQAELGRAMAEFHVFAHLAENDPAPNIVVEALAAGLPVLCRNSGGTPELIQGGVFGEMVSSEGPGPLGDALGKLMARYDDLVESVRQNREHFMIETSAREYAAVFRCAARR